MRAIAAAFALLALTSPAFAQDTQRLARPAEPSTMDADGRMVVSNDTTMGNITVDQYGRFGQRISAPGANRAAVVEASRPMMCNTQGAGGFARDVARRLIADLDEDTRARLKARDAAALTDLAIGIAAGLDQVDAAAIRADEAIGPGAYHDAINGFSAALDACDFFGLERWL